MVVDICFYDFTGILTTTTTNPYEFIGILPRWWWSNFGRQQVPTEQARRPASASAPAPGPALAQFLAVRLRVKYWRLLLDILDKLVHQIWSLLVSDLFCWVLGPGTITIGFSSKNDADCAENRRIWSSERSFRGNFVFSACFAAPSDTNSTLFRRRPTLIRHYSGAIRHEFDTILL